jgi:hypothetical protein
MRNRGHYQFLVTFRNLFITFKDVSLLVTDELAEFDQLLALEKALLDKDRKSPLTRKIEEADDQVNSDLIGMRSDITAALHKHEPAVVDAAKTLHDRMRQLGDIYDMPYEEQTAIVSVLLEDLTGKYAVLATTVGINPWVNDLLIDNQILTQLLAERNAEVANRAQGDTKQVRRLLEASYRNIMHIIEANIILDGNSQCEALVRQLNTDILYFNEHDTPHRTLKDLRSISVRNINTQIYTGKPVTILPEVYYAEAGQPVVELFFSTDYNISYRNNINPGTAEIILSGKGKYKGKKIINFNIARTV